MKCLGVLAFAIWVAGTVAWAVAFDSNWSVKDKRVININTVIRVNQIEVSREVNRGTDECHLHNVAACEKFRQAVADAIPEAKVTWAFSWRALHDQRPNYVAVRRRVVEYHRQYGDEITFIPGAYFAPMYNSREQTNRDIHDALKIISDMVGGGYRPHGIVAGFLAADNLRHLAEVEGIHVAQGTIWSQYGIDNGDGDGSISYPYYPSREHACKPAQGKDDFIDCVNLDGWTCDFICARRFGFEGGCNSRTGVGPIETYRNLGVENGLKETRAVVRSHFGDNFKRNGFGWIVVCWEVSLVPLYRPEVIGAMTTWLKGIREEFPDAVVPLMSEFGEAWRRENPDNNRLDYHFVQRGTGVPKAHSEPNTEIEWFMNRNFRLALFRDWTKNEAPKVVDFTRYDLPAKEPADATPKKPTRNWSLVNRINQKRRRPQDAPVPLSALTAEERQLVDGCLKRSVSNGTPAGTSTASNLRAYSLVTHDGRRLVSRVEGGKRVFELVATNALPAGLPPVRQWTIYGIKSAHTDLGLHRSHYVQRKGTVRRLEIAKDLFDADRRSDADPAAFRYVQEGWWGWFNFIAERGEAKARSDFSELLRRRRLDIGLSLCGSTTHLFGYEELARSLYPLRDLRTKWQVQGRTSQLVDNPGVTVGVIDPYVEAGIEHLRLAPNGWVPSQVNSGGSPQRMAFRYSVGTDHPSVFWWEAPSGNRLLVWVGSYIGGSVFGVKTAYIDQPSHPNPRAAEIPSANWQPDLGRMERTTALQLATLEKAVPYDVWIFSDYHDDEIPSMRLAETFAKWNEKWATPVFRTVGSLDEPFDRLREKFADAIPVVRGDLSCAWDRALPAVAELVADKLAADRQLPRVEAHATLASVTAGAEYPHDDLAHGYEALLLNDDHSYGFSGYSGRRCYDTWMQHRDWIETAARIAQCESWEKRQPETSPEMKAGRQENQWYRIDVNARGEITSIYDKELQRELLDGVANRLFYTRDRYRTWSEPAALGGKITQQVALDPNEKRIVIENTIRDAEDLWNTHRFDRYGHYAFPFKVENPRFYSQLAGPVVDAHGEVTPHTQDTYSCIRDWCAVENGTFGIALVQPDTCIVEYGELHKTNAYCRKGRPKCGHVYSHVFADGLQYQHDRAPSFRFRFILTSYAGSWRDAHIPAFAARQVGALAADRAVAAQVRAECPNVELTALKWAEDGNGLIVRFRETEGRETRTRIVQSLVKHARIARATVLEEPWKGTVPADGSVALRPFETVTLRLTGELPVLRAAAAKEPWTGLLIRPRVFPGGRGGTTYLLWGTDPAPDFDHYEVFRDGQLLATVANEVDDGVPYRNARYEDKTAGKDRHDYAIRSVYNDGRKGPLLSAKGTK